MHKLPPWAVGLAVLTIVGPATAKRAPGLGGAQALLKRGDAMVVVGSYDGAAKAYRQALELTPNNALVRARLAQCLHRTDKKEEALALLETIPLATAPVEALSVLGEIHVEQRSYLKATAVLEALLTRRADDLALKMQLAECYRQMASLNNPEARARALDLFADVEKASTDPDQRRRAMEAGLTMRFGEIGEKILGAKEQLAAGKAADALRALDALAKGSPKVAYIHYLRGMALLSPALDARPRALRAFEQAKDHPEAALQLGVLYFEDGDLDRATAQLKSALQAEPRNQLAYYHLGLIHRERGEDGAAVKAWRQAIALGSNTPIGRWAETKLQLLTGQVRALAVGQVIDPATEIEIGKKTCEMIERRWSVLRNPRLEARLQRIMDRLLLHSDRPKRDLRYKIAVINVPVPNALTVPNGKIYFFTGLIDLIRTRMRDSDDAYAAVLAHELAHNSMRHGTGMIKVASTQKSFNSFWQLSLLMSALSRSHEFEADQYGSLYAYRAGFDPAASILLHQRMLQHRGEVPRGMSHPRHAERISRLRDYLLELRAKARHFHKGLAALNKGEHDQAVDHLEVFLGVFPDSAAARNNLAVALHRKALLATKAAPVYRRSTDIDPDARVRAIKLRSATEETRRTRRIDRQLLREALSEYAMVVRQHAGYAMAHSNIATALSDLGELRLAKQHAERALLLRPRFKEALNNLGVIRAQLKDFRGADDALQRAVAIDPRYAAAHFNLALVHERRGDKRAAATHWERYVELDPDSGWTKVARARRAAIR